MELAKKHISPYDDTSTGTAYYADRDRQNLALADRNSR